jgi:hypothetical protein
MDTPTRVRAASGAAHTLAGIGGDEDMPVSITDDGGTLACEGSLDVFKKFRYNPRYCTVAGGLFKIYSSKGPGAPPKKTMSIATMTWNADMTNVSTPVTTLERRFAVDTGAEIIVLRAASVSDRNMWIRAFEREQSLLSPKSGAGGVGLARTTSIPWRLEIGDYLLAGNPIGAGGFGNVIQGMHRATHRRIAAKVLRLDSRVVQSEAVESEIATMGAVRCSTSPSISLLRPRARRPFAASAAAAATAAAAAAATAAALAADRAMRCCVAAPAQERR